MTTTVAWICLVVGLALFGVVYWWCAIKAGTLGEDDPEEFDAATLEGMRRETFDRYRDNRVQVPHAE